MLPPPHTASGITRLIFARNAPRKLWGRETQWASRAAAACRVLLPRSSGAIFLPVCVASPQENDSDDLTGDYTDPFHAMSTNSSTTGECAVPLGNRPLSPRAWFAMIR